LSFTVSLQEVEEDYLRKSANIATGIIHTHPHGVALMGGANTVAYGVE
jgi:hypothetical protein